MGIAGVLGATVALAASRNTSKRRLARALLTGGIPLIAATPYLTYSRGAVLGGVIAVVLLVALADSASPLSRMRRRCRGRRPRTWAVATDDAVANASGAAEGRTLRWSPLAAPYPCCWERWPSASAWSHTPKATADSHEPARRGGRPDCRGRRRRAQRCARAQDKIQQPYRPFTT